MCIDTVHLFVSLLGAATSLSELSGQRYARGNKRTTIAFKQQEDTRMHPDQRYIVSRLQHADRLHKVQQQRQVMVARKTNPVCSGWSNRVRVWLATRLPGLHNTRLGDVGEH
jgi:hypothetical protein